MTQVTKESLATKIKTLEEVKQHYGFMSIDQEYNLSAYRMLAEYMDSCSHDWIRGQDGVFRCDKCGRIE